MRLMQVCLEKALSDNILPFIREQTMTNTELEVAKRMDKVASTISQGGNYNINLDLSKWNQLQRHELNKYLFNELDALHGRENLYSDSHPWFGRCIVLLSSRLTPPQIGPDGEPLAGDFCHFNHLGGFEGMRQKAWTLSTIMIIKIALDECGLKGELMGQGDNQVIHLQLNDEQQARPHYYIRLLLQNLDHQFNSAGLPLKLQETWYSKNLFEYAKVRYYKSIRIDDSLKRLNRMIPDINEGFPSLQSLITSVSTTTENLSRNYLSPVVPFFFYSLELGNVLRRKGLIDCSRRDGRTLCALMNMPSILGGLPLSNMYQHCQRGCPDPLTIWVRILQVIRATSPDIYVTILHALPCHIKSELDPIRLVEDMYSLNISGLPNFERKAREIIEEFLPTYVTNPQVVRLLGANRSDLEELCNTLITMRPYIANLAHEILRNSNEGVQLQLIGSFTNLQTINRMINEDEERDENIFTLGKMKDREAIQLLGLRLEKSELAAPRGHILESMCNSLECTFQISLLLRRVTWGFPVTGISSPVPCEQIKVLNYDQTSPEERRDCIIVKSSYQLKTHGSASFKQRGPFEPYLGSSTPEKMMKPKLTVASPNPQIKAVTKLYYILTYLERMDKTSGLIPLLQKMIHQKLHDLPPVFRATPLEEWCGKNYGGSYEHRFKASSQKRSALYSLTENLATHVTINTNQLGRSLRGNEDYNLFFQEIFLYIQNYIAERAMHGYPIADTYAVPLNCSDCTYRIINQPISIQDRGSYYQSQLLINAHSASLSTLDMTPCIQLCVLAMSLAVGRKLTTTRLHEASVHNQLESLKAAKTDEASDRMSSNLMSEFRSSCLDYVLVGALQNSKQLSDFVLGKSQDYPRPLFEHLAYLVVNSDRLNEIVLTLNVRIEKHSSVTRTSGLAKVLAEATRTYIRKSLISFLRACCFTTFTSDLVSKQEYLWRTFLGFIARSNNLLTNSAKRSIIKAPIFGGSTVHEWNSQLPNSESQGLSVQIPFSEDDAISVWRDLKNSITAYLAPILPLTKRHRNVYSGTDYLSS